MEESAIAPIRTPGKSMGGLIGGEARKLMDHQKTGKGICGNALGKAMTYAMAASAAVELLGGTPKMCLDAASTVLMDMLGLVCDPVGGLVEYTCQNRNTAGVANPINHYLLSSFAIFHFLT